MTLNEYAGLCHNSNLSWWVDPYTKQPLERNKGELLMLIVSELSEAFEGERKGSMDDHLPNRKAAEVEIVDALIRLFDYAGAYNFDLDAIIQEKLAYNRVREDHKVESRIKPGGKKW